MELELETLDAVIAAAGRRAVRPARRLARRAGGRAAGRRSTPDRVDRLLLYGGWVRGRESASPDVQHHVLGLISQHWGLGSDVLTDIFAPDADAATRAAFIEYQRAAASADTVRTMLALSYSVDVTDALARISAPTLVVHRDRDRAAPLAQGRELAERIPGAELAVLPGRAHLPYIGDVDALARVIRGYLGLPALRRPVVPTLDRAATRGRGARVPRACPIAKSRRGCISPNVRPNRMWSGSDCGWAFARARRSRPGLSANGRPSVERAANTVGRAEVRYFPR